MTSDTSRRQEPADTGNACRHEIGRRTMRKTIAALTTSVLSLGLMAAVSVPAEAAAPNCREHVISVKTIKAGGKVVGTAYLSKSDGFKIREDKKKRTYREYCSTFTNATGKTLPKGAILTGLVINGNRKSGTNIDAGRNGDWSGHRTTLATYRALDYFGSVTVTVNGKKVKASWSS